MVLEKICEFSVAVTKCAPLLAEIRINLQSNEHLQTLV